MPSHIFTRVGAWEDSVATNARSAGAARKGNEGDEACHASDYWCTRTCSSGATARREAHHGRRAEGHTNITPRFVAPYAIAAMPARYAIERGDWQAAAQLEPRATKFPFVDAITLFRTRARRRAQRRPGAAEKECGSCASCTAAGRGEEHLLGDRSRSAAASRWPWIALAQGKADEAVKLMRAAADLEDKNEKHIVTPGRILPARELLGDMLLELKQPADALKEYEASQQREPNRFRGLYGAAQAAEQAGDAAKAKRYYAQLVKVAGKGDARPELAAARKSLSGN